MTFKITLSSRDAVLAYAPLSNEDLSSEESSEELKSLRETTPRDSKWPHAYEGKVVWRANLEIDDKRRVLESSPQLPNDSLEVLMKHVALEIDAYVRNLKHE